MQNTGEFEMYYIMLGSNCINDTDKLFHWDKRSTREIPTIQAIPAVVPQKKNRTIRNYDFNFFARSFFAKVFYIRLLFKRTIDKYSSQRIDKYRIPRHRNKPGDKH